MIRYCDIFAQVSASIMTLDTHNCTQWDLINLNLKICVNKLENIIQVSGTLSELCLCRPGKQ